MAQCVKRMELECLGCDSKLLRAGAKVVLRLAGGGIFDKFSSLSVQPLAIAIALLLYDQSMHMFSTTSMLLWNRKARGPWASRALKISGWNQLLITTSEAQKGAL